jgi:hypothetical protein
MNGVIAAVDANQRFDIGFHPDPQSHLRHGAQNIRIAALLQRASGSMPPIPKVCDGGGTHPQPVETLHRRGDAADALNVDDTAVPSWRRVPARPRPNGCELFSATSARSPMRPPAAPFFYSPDSQGRASGRPPQRLHRRHPRRCYCGYNEPLADRRILEAECWAHVRGKFLDADAATAADHQRGSRSHR